MDKLKYGLVILSIAIMVFCFWVLWIFFPLIVSMWGGVNFLSIGLLLVFISPFVFSTIYIISHALGKPYRRFRNEIVWGFVWLATIMTLSYVYNAILPVGVSVIWRYFVLPLLTLVIILYLLRRIPKVKEKLDKLTDI
jgi:hypothetical protein